MFYLVGIGINKNNLTNYILDKIEKSDIIYIEKYTSFFEDYEFLLNFLKRKNKNFIEAERNIIEEEIIKNLEKLKDKNVSILVFGDPLFATTHTALLIELKKKKINFEIIHNVSILNLMSRTGLSPYKFGKIISIPFLIRDKRIKLETPIKVAKENILIGAHTLFLLDLDPIKGDYLKVEEALRYLYENGIKENIIVCSRLGWKDEKIINIKELNEKKIENVEKLKLRAPLCLIHYTNLNVIEEEFLNTLEKL